MLNKTKKKSEIREDQMHKEAHANFMGGPSYDLTPFMKLYVMATSAFFGEAGYYSSTRKIEADSCDGYLNEVFGTFNLEVNGKTRAEAMVKAIEDSLEYDADLTLKFLVWLRNSALMRATPAVGLAVAAHSETLRGSGKLKGVSKSVLSRLDDVTNCLAFYLENFGKPLPNSLKKALASRLSDATEYELAKYKGANKSVSMRDAIRLVHAHSDAIDKFCRDELSQTGETWEAIISKEGSTKESWEKAVGVMGHMALLRNLRNLENHKVSTDLYIDKLVAGVENGKQFPFRYYTAYNQVTSDKLKTALETCIDKSVANLPKLEGNSLILVDNSGSALGTFVSALSNVNVSTCGNLMGVLTGLISDKAKIGVFGDKIKYIPVNKNFKGTALQMLTTVNEVGRHVGQATENGIWLALDDAIKSGEKYDRIFIYSDMQAGHGGLYGLDPSQYPIFKDKDSWNRYIDVPKLVMEYRSKVNPDCKLYSIQIGGYSDSIFPELYPNTCIMAGWSTELLKFVSMYEVDPMQIEEHFRKML